MKNNEIALNLEGEKMNGYLLTSLDGHIIVTNEDKTFRAQHLWVEEALFDGVDLRDMVEDVEGFMHDWIPITQEHGWGEVLDVYENNKTFEVSEHL